ncbi:hypothetical protein AB6A40_006462 [Gnathostoma spinigerum]|uniref:Uncharacterized protein n=1 Tax=Gnathostoma spinigerum TaxID=75299 RepID=A0ABD6ERW3_9BILA
MSEARLDLERTNKGTEETEELANRSNSSLEKLEADMKNISVQYLQISEHAKNAIEAADKAIQQATLAEAANEKLKGDFSTARELLEKRQNGNAAPQARAEGLRKRATQLLHKTQRHRADILQLTADMDTSDLRLGEYNQSVSDLQDRIKTVTIQIQKRMEYYSSCDV